MKKLKDLTNVKEIKVSELMALKGGMMEMEDNELASGCTTSSCTKASCENHSCATTTCNSQACNTLMDCQTKSAK